MKLATFVSSSTTRMRIRRGRTGSAAPRIAKAPSPCEVWPAFATRDRRAPDGARRGPHYSRLKVGTIDCASRGLAARCTLSACELSELTDGEAVFLDAVLHDDAV